MRVKWWEDREKSVWRLGAFSSRPDAHSAPSFFWNASEKQLTHYFHYRKLGHTPKEFGVFAWNGDRETGTNHGCSRSLFLVFQKGAKNMATFLCAENSTEWQAARLEGIGSSESAAAMGRDDYMTARELWSVKTGEVEPEDLIDVNAVAVGKALEAPNALLFERETGRAIERSPGLFRHQEFPWMLATPDGLIEPRELWEGKSTTWYVARDILGAEGTDELPTRWLIQCQKQMAVMDCDVVNLSVLIDGRNFKPFRIEREPRLIEFIEKSDREFWERVQNLDPPEIDYSHQGTDGFLRRLNGTVDPGKVVELSPLAIRAWTERTQINSTIKQLKEISESLRNVVLDELGDAEAGLLPEPDEGTKRKMVKRSVSDRKSYTVAEKLGILRVSEVNAIEPKQKVVK